MAATRPLPAPAQAWNCHQDDWPLAPSAGNPWLGLLLVQQVCQCQRRPSTPASWRQSTQHLAIYPALERHTASRAASLASRPPSPSTVYGMLPCLLTRSPALPATMPHGGGRCGAGQKSAAAPLAVGPSSLWTGPRAFAAACLRTRPCACASHCGPQWNEQQASRGGGPCVIRKCATVRGHSSCTKRKSRRAANSVASSGLQGRADEWVPPRGSDMPTLSLKVVFLGSCAWRVHALGSCAMLVYPSQNCAQKASRSRTTHTADSMYPRPTAGPC